MRFTDLVPAHFIVFLVTLAVCTFLHLAALFVAGWVSGVELLRFGFGIGPRLWKYRRFELKLLPIAGHVEFRTLRNEEVDTAAEEVDLDDSASRRSLDLQPRHRQVLISLSGCAALLVLACAILGPQAGRELVRGFVQIIGGALSPLDTAQSLLHSARRQLLDLSPVHLLALVAVKVAALNLLPLVPFNGASAVSAAVSGHATSSYGWQRWNQGAIWLSIAIGASWSVAFLVYLRA